jgi:osmotically-inducible protein OsmY
MNKTNRFSSLALAVALTAALCGCQSFEKCDTEACTRDAQINTEVHAQISAHREFGAPAAIRVQTKSGVVYLNGEVDTDLTRNSVEAVARQVANVRDVVNNIDVRGNGR